MNQNQDHEQPVAYDTQGRPLYLKPQTPNNSVGHDEMQVVQVTRSSDPVPVEVSPVMQQRHAESKARYSFLNLSDGEYVIKKLKRNFVGNVSIWAITGLIVLLIVICWLFLITHPWSEKTIISASAIPLVSAFAVGLVILSLAIGWVAQTIYKNNMFFLTNESIIQRIQYSILSQKEQTINLENIEDASFEQKGLMQNIFGYGTIKVTAINEGESYIFSLVDNPKTQIAIINNVVEAVKYGRPIDEALDNIPK